MRILQVITPQRVSGAERSTTSLCEHLQAAGHHVVVACKVGSPLIPLMKYTGVDVRALRIAGKANLLAPIRLVTLARAERAAVIHTHLSTAAMHGATASFLTGLPVVSHVRALNSAFCFRRATRLIAVSEAVRDHMVAQGIERERIDVVYSGIDAARYFLPCSREDAKRRMGLPTDTVMCGLVGHLSPKKGHAVFLDALQALHQKYPALMAVFVGEGTEQDALEARVAAMGLQGRVIFAGYQENPLPYYAAMDLVVLPSIDGEGLPRALLEGGMLGRACIGSRLSGVPEIIRNGETGLITPVGDSAALTEAIDTLCGDPGLREHMGTTAEEWIRETFTVKAMIEGTLKSYRAAGCVMDD